MPASVSNTQLFSKVEAKLELAWEFQITAVLHQSLDGPLRILRALVGRYATNGVPDGLAERAAAYVLAPPA